MRRTRKKSLTTVSGGTVDAATARLRPLTAPATWWPKLFAGRSGSTARLKSRDVIFILRNLAALTEHGVPLPRAVGTLAEEKALERHREMLLAIRRRLENGETFTAALTQFGDAFDPTTINQIRVGEHSGTLPETLTKVAERRESAHRLRSDISSKLAYPVLLVVMGTAVITFLLTYVIPVFQETYESARVPLPMITMLLITVGVVVKSYGWILLLLLIIGVLVVKQLRHNREIANSIDEWTIRLPIVGHWLRDVAVLQLMEALGNLLEAGFTLQEALGESVQAIGNRAVQQGVRELQTAVRRGERFSREIDRHGNLFPPIVSQLVIVGEQTGTLTGATSHIRDHLRREIERQANVFVAMIEPTLTIGLAAAIAAILMAVYLPMFDMVSTMK